MKSIIDRIFSIKALLSLLLVFATTSAWAAVPTVAWDGDFGTTEKTGSDGQTYTFTLNPSGNSGENINTLSNGKVVIGANSSYGAKIEWTKDTSTAYTTVLVKYSGLTATANKTIASVTASQNNDAIIDCGVAVDASDTTKLVGRFNNDNRSFGSYSAVVSSGYLLMVYTAGSVFQFYTSADGVTWTGGNATGLSFSNTHSCGVGLGGMSGRSTSSYGASSGITIEAVAIYRGIALNAVKARNCHFDSEYTTQTYKKWAYANSVLTYAKSGNADIGSSGTDFKSFNIATGADGETTYYGGGNTAYFGTAFWHNYCCNQSAYSAPGCVLRVASAYAVSAGFSYAQGPLTLGGLIVESTADGCSFPGNSQSTVLGSASASSETWFGINGNATINRTGFMFIAGTVNIDVAEGKTFSLNASQTTAANYPTIKANVTTASDATGAGDAGGVLKMHGLGTITVPTLIASNEATLDFSDVQENATVVRSTTPFIQGNLTVDATTKLVLPAGLAEGAAYKICSGTLTAPAKTVQTSVQIGSGDAFTAYVTYKASDKTVSYSTSAPTYTGTVDGSTITWDVTPTAEDLADGNVVLTGSGEVTLAAEPISINAASGVTVNVAGYEAAVLSGEGTFKFTSGYRTNVPSGMTYQYVGSNDSANPAAIAGVTVTGTLKTSGYTSLTSLVIDAAGTLDVLSESTSVATTYRSDGEGNLSGTIVIESGATLVNVGTDALDWSGTTRVDIYGTLSMGGTRWSIRQDANCKINLYPGAQVTGAGDGNGVFDLFNNTSKLNVYPGTSGGTATISGPVRFRNSGHTCPVWVAANTTLALTGGTLGSGGFQKTGAGTISLSGTLANSGSSTLSEGVVNFGVSAAANITYANANAYVTADNGVVVTGTITAAASGSAFVAPGGNMQTFLKDSAKWQGTLSIPACSSTSTAHLQVALHNFGNGNSVIALAGVSNQSDSYGTWIAGGGTTTVNATLQLNGNVIFNQGSSGASYVLNKITGTGNLTVAAFSGCTDAGLKYTINEINGYSGTITANNNSGNEGCKFTLKIGNIVSTSKPLVPITTGGSNANLEVDISETTVAGVSKPILLTTVDDTKGIYLADATYGGQNYLTVQEAINEAGSENIGSITINNASATIPSGYALVTAAGGAMTLRSAGNGGLIYWAAGNSGDWSGEASNGTHTFYTAAGGTSTTPYVSGDTVVFTSDTQIWSKTAAHGAKFQIGTDTAQAEVHFTRSGDHCDNYILDGSTIEIKSGSTLVAERYGDTEPPTQAYTQWNSYSSHNGSEINDTTITGAGTFKVGGDTGGHGAAAAILSGTSTIADTVTVKFADGATLTVPSVSAFSGSGVVTLDVGDVTPNASGVALITFSDTTPSDASKFASSAALAIDGNALKAYPAAATAVNVTTGKVIGYGTLQAAVDAAVADLTGSTYVVAQADGTATASVNVIYFKPNGFTATIASTKAGYAYVQGQELSQIESGLYVYTSSPAAATFTWNGGSSGDWKVVGNWTSEDGEVTAYPNNALYTVVFDSNAAVTLNSSIVAYGINVGGVVTITAPDQADPTITAATGGIVLTDAAASITVSGVTLSQDPTSGVDLMYVTTTPSEGTTTYALQSAGTVEEGVAKITDATAEVTVPASATSIETVPVATIKLAEDSTITADKVTVKYGDHDITTAFTKAVSAGVVSLSLNSSGYYQNGDGESNRIQVRPAVADSSPMTMGESSAGFTVKAIPGLYYAVKAYDNAACTGAATDVGSAVQAEGVSASPAAPTFTGTVKYYKISVGISAEDARQ